MMVTQTFFIHSRILKMTVVGGGVESHSLVNVNDDLVSVFIYNMQLNCRLECMK